MFAGPMRKTYALSLIDKFPPLPKASFPRMDCAELIAGPRERVNDPVKQDQGAASLCCPRPSSIASSTTSRSSTSIHDRSLHHRQGPHRLTRGQAGHWRAASTSRRRKRSPPSIGWRFQTSPQLLQRDPGRGFGGRRAIGGKDPREGEVSQVVPADRLRQGVRDNSNIFISKGRKEIEAFDRDARAAGAKLTSACSSIPTFSTT